MLSDVDGTDPLDVMRACHDRRLEREGIPMILGLADERGELAPGSASQRVEGLALADSVERLRTALVPWARDDEEAALITVMQVLAVTDFEPPSRPTGLDDDGGGDAMATGSLGGGS